MKLLRNLSLFTFVTLCLPSHAVEESNLLMVAGRLNYMKAIESRCNAIIPGYSTEFQGSYSAAKENMFDKVGLTDEVFFKANKTPELATAPLVKKFDQQALETRKLYCEQNLQSLKEAAVAKKEPGE